MKPQSDWRLGIVLSLAASATVYGQSVGPQMSPSSVNVQQQQSSNLNRPSESVNTSSTSSDQPITVIDQSGNLKIVNTPPAEQERVPQTRPGPNATRRPQAAPDSANPAIPPNAPEPLDAAHGDGTLPNSTSAPVQPSAAPIPGQPVGQATFTPLNQSPAPQVPGSPINTPAVNATASQAQTNANGNPNIGNAVIPGSTAPNTSTNRVPVSVPMAQPAVNPGQTPGQVAPIVNQPVTPVQPFNQPITPAQPINQSVNQSIGTPPPTNATPQAGQNIQPRTLPPGANGTTGQ